MDNQIVILGAGTFGGSIAETLSKENRVTVVDIDAEKLNRLRSRIDARFIVGNADSPRVLERAGCEEADVLLAVTGADVLNLAACHISRSLFGNEEGCTRIARIRNDEFMKKEDLLERFGVTEAYNPEDLVADAVVGVVELEGAQKAFEFWRKRAYVLVVKLAAGQDMVGGELQQWYDSNPTLGFRVLGVRRGDDFIAATPDLHLLSEDELLMASKGYDAIRAIRPYRDAPHQSRKVFIGGGGKIGEAVAERLEGNHAVTLIEPDPLICAELVQKLGSTLVDTGDPTDVSMLKSEDIEHADYFCALMESDEQNIMAALIAKELGCKKNAVLVNRLSYHDILVRHNIDSVISPSAVTHEVLAKTLSERKRDGYRTVLEKHRGGLLEFTVQEKSRIENKLFGEIEWPANIYPCMFASKGDVENPSRDLGLHFADSDAQLGAGDSVVVYVTDGNQSTIEDLIDLPYFHF